MKLRTLLAMAIGVAIGYLVANKLREDDPNIVTGPQRQASNGNGAAGPVLRVVSSGAQRLADQAGTVGVDAIRRARGAIQARMSGDIADDVDWG